MKIQTTTNLEQFQFDGRNRNINRKHVKELADSIIEYGQLQPIIVNTSMKVMEGQHRLEAIKLINKTAATPIKVKYIKKNMPISQVAQMNSHQRQWRIQDWIHYYAQSGNGHYLKLQEATEMYKPLKLSSLASFLHVNDSGATHTSVIRKGEFRYTMTDDKQYILEKLVAISRLKPMFSMKCVLVAIMWLQRDPNFNAQRLFHALERNFESILPQAGTGNWARHMLYWYNKGLRGGKLNVNDLPRHH